MLIESQKYNGLRARHIK
jgi:hypothetical protein